MPTPLVSVVVATRDRPARLRRLLDALRAQTLSRASFEVVIVDDGSGPETVALLGPRGALAGLDARVLRHSSPRGPGAARNAGWRVARAELVAFTDDDCAPAPGWLDAGLEARAARPEAFVQGRTLPDPAERSREGLLSRTLRVEDLGPLYETCNMFYPRELLEVLEGFDEGFGLTPGGEDTDLAWRAIRRGREAVFAADAVVFHAVEQLGMRGMLRVAARWSESVRVVATYPQTRSRLAHGLFWNVWHYMMVRSLLALVAPRAVRRLILTRHLLALRRRAHGAGAGTAAVAFLALHDLVEVAAVVRGAIRHRTLVL